MRAIAVRRGENPPDLAGRILCHDVPGLYRKGHALRADDVPPLLDAAWSELHLLELDSGDIAQGEAGERLAHLLAAPGLEIVPAGHRHLLRARHKGLLKVDVAALQALNAIDGLAVFTLQNDAVVAVRQVVAEAQITPLAIDGRSIEKAHAVGPILSLLPYAARDVAVFSRDDRVLRMLSAKLSWFGSTIRDAVDLPRDPKSIREAMERRRETLVIVSGSNALDPLDPVFVALAEMGAEMQRIGMPVHPGTLLWIAAWRGATIIGLPSCGAGTQRTAFDLVLPKILAEGGISGEEVAALGHGGILNSICTRTFAEETADEPVR